MQPRSNEQSKLSGNVWYLRIYNNQDPHFRECGMKQNSSAQRCPVIVDPEDAEQIVMRKPNSVARCCTPKIRIINTGAILVSAAEPTRSGIHELQVQRGLEWYLRSSHQIAECTSESMNSKRWTPGDELQEMNSKRWTPRDELQEMNSERRNSKDKKLKDKKLRTRNKK